MQVRNKEPLNETLSSLVETLRTIMAGSIGYAERLSWRDDVGGMLGTPEFQEVDDAELQRKIDTLAELICESRAKSGGMVVHTGAGISTSIGIPDFRGPNGVWTAQKRGGPMPQAKCTLDTAVPSLTHMALVELRKQGYVRYLVSCNVDCLHLRSGFPRKDLAELHGNCFAERCERCDAEYIRDFEMRTVGFEYTGRTCDVCVGAETKGREKKRQRSSGSDAKGVAPRRSSRASTSRSAVARLRDQVLDWDDALPPEELRLAEKHSRETCLSLVLGSSLQIAPSCDIPLKTVKNKGGKRGKLVIVNLQATPKDRMANLLIRAKTDVVMAGVMRRLGLRVPEYVRRDSVTVSFFPSSTFDPTDAGEGPPTLAARAGSSHGWGNPIPWLERVTVEMFDGDDLKSDHARCVELRNGQTRDGSSPGFRGPGDDGGSRSGNAPPPSDAAWAKLTGPASLEREHEKTRVRVELTFAAGCTERHAGFWTEFDDPRAWTGDDRVAGKRETRSVITSRRTYEDPLPVPNAGWTASPVRKKESKSASSVKR